MILIKTCCWRRQTCLFLQGFCEILFMRSFYCLDNSPSYEIIFPLNEDIWLATLPLRILISFLVCFLCSFIFNSFHLFLDCLCLFVWIIIMLGAQAGFFSFSELVQGRDNRDFIRGRWIWGTPLDSSSHCQYGRQLPNFWALPTPPHFSRTLFLFYLFFFPKWMWLCALWEGHFLKE